MKNANITFIFLLIFLVQGCAIRKTPSGGPKDTKSPKVVKAEPPINSVNFSGKKIEIKFNEFFQMGNTYEEVLISPPMEEKPDFTVKGKKLEIILKEDLKENTTYVINFGESIKDYHKGNILKGFNYVFSTGPVIDSLKLNGLVLDAFSHDPLEAMKILVYRGQKIPDTAERPYYYALTGKSGRYRITNMKKGKYQIIAIEDINRNFSYDQGEKIGFFKRPVGLTRDTVINPLYNFQPPNPEFEVLEKKSVRKGKFKLKLGRPVDTVAVQTKTSKNKKGWEFWQLEEEGEKIIYWNTAAYGDSVLLELTINDTVQKTVKVYQENIKKGRTDSLFKWSANFLSGKIKPGKGLYVEFPDPVVSVDTSKVKILEDSVKQVSSGKVKFLNFAQTRALIPVNLKSNVPYWCEFEQGAFVSVFHQMNDKVSKGFGVLKPENFGFLSAILRDTLFEGNNFVVVQIRGSDKGKLVREKVVKRPGIVSFPLMEPGKYRLKLIYDRDHNRRWTPGNYEENIYPEKVYFYPEIIHIRENWELRELMIPPKQTQ